MNYKDRARNRRLKKDIITLLNIFKFKTGNIKLPGKVVLFGLIISIIGIFSPRIVFLENLGFENSFSSLAGNVGFTSLIGILFLIFIVLSINKKEKIKMYSGLQIKDYTIIIFIGFFIAILSIHSIIFIKSLLSFSKDIILGKGSILGLTGSIIIIVGGIMMKKDYNKENASYINEAEDKSKYSNNRNKNSNMKLPF
ncbi:hypothetical protein CSB07_01385 [Candidatus Gracilibacteria bacterium]|nr:MAG: hypothetical protein CSB07_01385 [Candidatus Gracilibacteria bacterium]PIE85067.1 MAG: hypothetical protein CSA08_03950 [Candidatus Gracilibacteria bacterium]